MGNAATDRLTAYRRAADALRREVRADPLYPRYHLAAPFGSAGDTHPIYAGGRYHVTYQHSYSPDFRAMHGPCQWGHAASADLVTWTHYPPALTSAEHGVAADRHLWSASHHDAGAEVRLHGDEAGWQGEQHHGDAEFL